MKKILFFVSLISCSVCFSQLNHQPAFDNEPYARAVDLFEKKDYALAYPILNELKETIKWSDGINSENKRTEIKYYYIVSSLFLQKTFAANDAKEFLKEPGGVGWKSSLSYYLGHYYFIENDFAQAITYFNQAGYNSLLNDEIAEMKFELAYSYFYEKDYVKAKGLFNEIHQLPGNKYYLPSNYYFGFIAYRDKEYAPALESFKLVEKLPEYSGIVPYYIAEIYYFQQNKEESLKYTLAGLGIPNQYYKKELQLLAAQLYFENGNYKEAVPLFEAYAAANGKITKQIMYQLSYSYYSLNDNQKAIDGFKQLSSEQDSLGQNSMYLLGGIYLRLNDKLNARTAFAYSANNSTNLQQQEVSIFNYAKLSYELKYNDVALAEIRKFISKYPSSIYQPEATEILVDLLGNTNNFKDALEMFSTIQHPSINILKVYPKLIYGRATEIMNEQRLDAAAELFRKVLSIPYSDRFVPFSNFWLAEIAYRQERFDSAIQYAAVYMAKGGSMGEANINNANYLMGYSYLKNKQYQQALVYFKQVPIQLNKGNTVEQDAYLRIADCYFMLKDYNSAERMYATYINAGLPFSDYAIYQTGLIKGINSLSDKINAMQALIKSYPKSELVQDANLDIANSYMAEEKFKDAVPYLTSIVGGNNVSLKPKALLKLGLIFYNLNDNNNALDNYKKLLKDYPQSSESDLALENLKSIYVDQGKADDYISLLKSAGKVISTSAADSLTFNTAQKLYNAGNCKEAINAMNSYLTKFTSGTFTVTSYFELGDCYQKQKEWINAMHAYDSVISKKGSLAEKAALQSGRIAYLEQQDYQQSKHYFQLLKTISTTPENQLEALRGLVRSYYYTLDFTGASEVAKELLLKKNISTDDRAIGNLVLGKALEEGKLYEEAIIAFRTVAAINKQGWGSEARYEIAKCYFILNNLTLAEKGAMEVIKFNGSSDLWIAKSYLLLGDIYMLQKDYFNAKATFLSVATNASIPEIKIEAQHKLEVATEAEQQNSKLLK